ncbi:hypothetical protein KUTeg_012396 [Tegillarca granosa]|uniref:Uncharacterized protein n=1 Tax=Tegillarca granosa TaxID=220873 RepID=A0ABQ9F1U4_TEGGR|nr:hypothetical protein KUTeg_012396 [Tegillarca granosa]
MPNKEAQLIYLHIHALKYIQRVKKTKLPLKYSNGRNGYEDGFGMHREEKHHKHRKHNHSRHENGGGAVAGYTNSDSTINSRKSLKSTERKKQMRIGLILLLLIGALLIAFGIGLLVYFLLYNTMSCAFLS